MKIWIFPGYEESHPEHAMKGTTGAKDFVLKNADYLRDAIMKGRKELQTAGNEINIEVTNQSDYKIIMSKVMNHSQTFLEYLELVKKEMYDILLVTDRCYLHGQPETIGRFYDVEDPTIIVIGNQRIYEERVKRILHPPKNTIETSDSLRNRAIFSLMWESGLRVNDIMNLN